MAEVVEAWSFRRDGLYRVCERVMARGQSVSPRGQSTREVIDLVLDLAEPEDSLLDTHVRPRFNPAIAAAESAQLIGGVSDPAMMVRISKNFAAFRNAGIFMGAYGPRLRSQLPQLVERLREDRSTRQAVLSIWRPQDDLWATNVADVPCTVMLQFLIRDDRLVLHTTMRSNDLWLGITYDVFQFTQLQCTVANVLGLETGHYYHHAVSAHIYERDFDKVAELAHPSTVPSDFKPLTGFQGSTMREAMATAVGVIDGSYQNPDLNPTLTWYGNTLGSYRG